MKVIIVLNKHFLITCYMKGNLRGFGDCTNGCKTQTPSLRGLAFQV